MLGILLYKYYSIVTNGKGGQHQLAYPTIKRDWWRGRLSDQEFNDTDFTSNGARHPNGTLGMIVDPSPKRLYGPVDYGSYMNICPAPQNGTMVPGFEEKETHLALQKIRRGVLKSRAFLEKSNHSLADAEEDEDEDDRGMFTVTTTMPRRKKSRILCMVYTVHYVEEHGFGYNDNLKAQAETWGRQCDGFIAASNFTDHSVGAIDLPHAGPEEYENMWQKTRSMLAYAYHHYQDFDFFHLCGDDVYIVLDNLRAYVDGPEVAKLENGFMDKISANGAYVNAAKKWASVRPRPLIFGVPTLHRQIPVIAGGPGYLLNRAALNVYGEKVMSRFLPANHDSREDVFIALGFAAEGIFLSDQKDYKEGERWWGGSAQSAYNFDGTSPIRTKRNFGKLGLRYLKGIDLISEQFISFHLKDDKSYLKKSNITMGDWMRRYHVVLNGLCKEDTPRGHV